MNDDSRRMKVRDLAFPALSLRSLLMLQLDRWLGFDYDNPSIISYRGDIETPGVRSHLHAIRMEANDFFTRATVLPSALAMGSNRD